MQRYIDKRQDFVLTTNNRVSRSHGMAPQCEKKHTRRLTVTAKQKKKRKTTMTTTEPRYNNKKNRLASRSMGFGESYLQHFQRGFLQKRCVPLSHSASFLDNPRPAKGLDSGKNYYPEIFKVIMIATA